MKDSFPNMYLRPSLASAILLLLAIPGQSHGEPSQIVHVSSLPEAIAPGQGHSQLHVTVPQWVPDAVFYQIVPERFRNSDRNNDPTRESLGHAGLVPEDWSITSWTSDWYAQANWERSMGRGFYGRGVYSRRYGGDLQGVIDKLDYLQDLGITALYFNPVFYAPSLHKYDATSMHHIDPYFGPDPQGDLEIIAGETSDPGAWQWTAADRLFLELITQVHKRGMRLIIDGVFNHTGRGFFAFADILERQANSSYRDWYEVRSFDDLATNRNEFRYRGWWGSHSLPVFADNKAGDDLHIGPKRYVMNITRRWMDPDGDGDPSDGVDGWRLDVANEVPTGFWQDWHALVRKINPEAYTVGEFWGNAHELIVKGGFSGTMNYHNFAYPVKGFLIDGRITAKDFGNHLQTRLAAYPASLRFTLQNLVDSHDTARLASMIVNRERESYKNPEQYDYDTRERVSPRHWNKYDLRCPNSLEKRIQRLVAFMQMTFVGPPMIYYGTESGMWGADDPCDRMPMVWDDLVYDDQASDPIGRQRIADPVQFDKRLFEYYKKVINLRNATPVLRRGSFELAACDDSAMLFTFRRLLDGESRLIAINRSKQPCEWRIANKQTHSLRQDFATVEAAEQLDVRQEGNDSVMQLPALAGVVFSELPDIE